MIISFCANRIKELIAKPKIVEKWQLIPWVKFKQLLYRIYEHRVEFAHEINGTANSSYCALQEYILVYFFDTLRDRYLAEK